MRRAIIASTVVVLLLVIAGVAYVMRGRINQLRSTPKAGVDHAAMGVTAGASPQPVAGQSGATPRGDVTIDPRRQQLIGVRTTPVAREPLSQAVRTVGVVRYDETSLTDVNLRLDGWIRDLYVDYTGQAVQKGQPLFTFYSPDLLATQQEYLLALRTRDQMRTSLVPDARERAEQLVSSARQRLALWNLPEDEIQSLDEKRQPPEVVTFRSPVSGFVIEKPALRGLHVTPGQTLYKVANLDVVWVEANIYEQEMAVAHVGQPAMVSLDAYPGETFRGRAIYVYPFVEENTRTVKVRFQFANTRGRLKPGMYANVELKGGGTTGLVVPSNAVLDSGAEKVVFVAQGDGYFTPRAVKIGRRLGDRIEVLDGVKEGEQVATSATFFLDSESQLRAGLQNYEPPQPGQASPVTDAGSLDITFRTEPDPPRTGETPFEVAVKDAKGQPVADADVSVLFFMPAMPTMNMPAMRNETKLPHAGGGVYKGSGQVMMAGRWDVTVTVTRGGQAVGRKQFAVTAR
jgi:RND family efflux transporter MFP subunit